MTDCALIYSPTGEDGIIHSRISRRDKPYNVIDVRLKNETLARRREIHLPLHDFSYPARCSFAEASPKQGLASFRNTRFIQFERQTIGIRKENKAPFGELIEPDGLHRNTCRFQSCFPCDDVIHLKS